MNIKQQKSLEDFIYMEQLELKYYSRDHVTPYQEAYLWHLSNPKAGFALEDCDNIVAFSDILPVKQHIYDGIISGTYNDKYLTGFSEFDRRVRDMKSGLSGGGAQKTPHE